MILSIFIIPIISILVRDYDIYPSIMLNNKEEKLIDNFLDSLKQNDDRECESNINTYPKDHIQPLFLSAIIFFSKKNWTIWINDQAIHPKQKSDFLKIYKVDYDHVVFSIPSLSEKKFFITPNQTFIPALEKVVSGDARQNEAKPQLDDQQKKL
jgi:hypothetical protein